MPSKLEQFLTDKKIDRRQLITVSKHLENLQPEDRTIRLAKRQGKVEGADEKTKAAGKAKPRSGRPITPVALDKIVAGKDVTGPTKTRLLKAINTILERRKQPVAAITDVFDLAKKA